MINKEIILSKKIKKQKKKFKNKLLKNFKNLNKVLKFNLSKIQKI